MKFLFSDFSSSPLEHTQRELKRYGVSSAPADPPNPGPDPDPPVSKGVWWQIFIEQVLNSLIVGGIAGLSALSAGSEAGGKAALIAFSITALIELRKYRKL